MGDHQPGGGAAAIGLPHLSGIEVATRISAELPRTRVVARMLQAGAAAYLIKECAFDELTDAIDTVMRGRKFLGAGIAGTMVDLVHGIDQPGSALDALTDREREVMQMVAEGSTAKEMAGALGVSAKTIDTHRHHVMEKLRVESVAELTRIAIREGIVPLEE